MKALSLALASLLAAASAPAAELPKFADWARVPASGLAIPGAQVTILDELGAAAQVYRDAGGVIPAPNPLVADGAGHFEFFAPPGVYDLGVSEDGGADLYRIPAVHLVDPSGPQEITSTAALPALTLEQPAADHPLNRQYSTTALRIERRTPGGALFDAPWLYNGYRAEQGMGPFYNTYGRYENAPEVPSLFLSEPFGANTADAGNFGLGTGLNVDWHGGGILAAGEGGVWLSAAAGTTVNVDMGIDGTAPAARQVVVLSPTVPSSVKLTSTPAARVPFVVAAVQNGRALVAVSGITTVLVKGRVNVGDALTTSATAGYAQKALSGVPATSTFGSALTGSAGGGSASTVRVRLGMVPTP
jgi:hypothetical protein